MKMAKGNRTINALVLKHYIANAAKQIEFSFT